MQFSRSAIITAALPLSLALPFSRHLPALLQHPHHLDHNGNVLISGNGPVTWHHGIGPLANLSLLRNTSHAEVHHYVPGNAGWPYPIGHPNISHPHPIISHTHLTIDHPYPLNGDATASANTTIARRSETDPTPEEIEFAMTHHGFIAPHAHHDHRTLWQKTKDKMKKIWNKVYDIFHRPNRVPAHKPTPTPPQNQTVPANMTAPENVVAEGTVNATAPINGDFTENTVQQEPTPGLLPINTSCQRYPPSPGCVTSAARRRNLGQRQGEEQNDKRAYDSESHTESLTDAEVVEASRTTIEVETVNQPENQDTRKGPKIKKIGKGFLCTFAPILCAAKGIFVRVVDTALSV